MNNKFIFAIFFAVAFTITSFAQTVDSTHKFYNKKSFYVGFSLPIKANISKLTFGDLDYRDYVPSNLGGIALYPDIFPAFNISYSNNGSILHSLEVRHAFNDLEDPFYQTAGSIDFDYKHTTFAYGINYILEHYDYSPHNSFATLLQAKAMYSTLDYNYSAGNIDMGYDTSTYGGSEYSNINLLFGFGAQYHAKKFLFEAVLDYNILGHVKKNTFKDQTTQHFEQEDTHSFIKDKSYKTYFINHTHQEKVFFNSLCLKVLYKI